jgi:glycosyltransferase involved in cell wall biosynthesis
MYIAYDNRNIVRAISDQPFRTAGRSVAKICDKLNREEWPVVIGKTLTKSDRPTLRSDLRVAMICNWKDQCGISTYASFLADSLAPQVKELKIFSEINGTNQEPGVEYCWRRGQSMREAAERVLAWSPDFVIVQHEYGLFPNAFHYMQMTQALENVPYIVVMHSVYEHLDKALCTGVTRNIVVHSRQGKELLLSLGNNATVDVIPHGCVKFPDASELWNTFSNPYTVVQFGFGFQYKGMDRAIDALHHLKSTDPKFKDIYYVCLISTNEHNTHIHNDYYTSLCDKVEKLGMQDNVVFHRKFFSEEIINYFLRTCKIAIFPYKIDPNNTVYGASGAVRVAMANGIPAVASESHLFDDLEGVIPRPTDHLALAREIDQIFSDDVYRKGILDRSREFLEQSSWDRVAARYLDVYESVWHQVHKGRITLVLNPPL